MLATRASTRHVEPPNQWVDLWDLARGAWVRSLDAGMTGVLGRWVPGGGFLTTADPSTAIGHIVLWSATTWTPRYATDFYCLTNVDFDPPGHQMFIAGCDGMLVRVDTTTGKTRVRPAQEAHLGGDVDVFVKLLGASGPLLVVDQSWGVQLLDPGNLRRRLNGPTEPPLPENANQAIGSWALSPDASLLATAKANGTLEVLRTASLKREKVLIKAGPDPRSRQVAWLGSERLLVRDQEGALTEMSLDGRTRSILPEPTSAACASRAEGNPSGSLAVVVDGRCNLALWDVARGSFRWTRPLPPAVLDTEAPRDPQVTWSPRGDRLAVISPGGALQILDDQGAVLRESRLGGAVSSTTGIQWSPDGELLAMGDGNLHVLRVRDGEEVTLALFEGEPGPDAVVLGRSRFVGKSSLVRCVAGAPAGPRAQPALLADFFGQRPLAGER
jgi:WD40 repeat protein